MTWESRVQMPPERLPSINFSSILIPPFFFFFFLNNEKVDWERQATRVDGADRGDECD